MDPTPLWDFEDPATSLQRFVAARAEAGGRQPDDAVLATQQARALGLLARYTDAHAILDSVPTDDAGVAVRTRLERGRLQRSAGVGDLGRADFEVAAALAEPRRDEPPFGGLHVDALHMLVLLAATPDEQIKLSQDALAAADASRDPAARRWRASLLNNLGMSRHDAGDDAGALEDFRRALELRRAAGERRESQIARYMVGWVLRLLGRFDEAAELQRALRAELISDGISDQYVNRELELIAARSRADG